MSVLLETSLGDIVIDLLVDYAPTSCENFLKLCKVKYYNYSPIYNVQPNFSFQTGDPIGPGSKDSDGGTSIWALLEGLSKKTFKPELHPKLKHIERGTVSMATAPAPGNKEDRVAGSQFLITLGDNLEYLDRDGRGAIFGKVVEGFDVLEKINTSFVDSTGRPLKDIRIRHTVILDDPFPDPRSLREPSKSPVPSSAQMATVRIADDEELDENMDEEELEKLRREREARAQALTLEMVGDLPFAEVKPPENVLFVCKLNPVTQDEDLELIFSRFGKILSCEVIRDRKTGDSLQYAFIEYEEKKDCEQAFDKMQDVLIDDHRIHVDFSQSVSKLSDSWRDATNSKRRKQHGGGWGGIANLEKKRHYRADRVEREREDRPNTYGMVHDRRREARVERGYSPSSDRRRRAEELDRRTYRSRSRDRNLRGDHNREYDRDRHRDRRRRSGSRGRDDRKDERRRRTHSRSPHRARIRPEDYGRRERSRDRYGSRQRD